MADTLLIEAGAETVLALTIEQAPELVFEEEGIQGPPGPISPPLPGDAIKVVGETVHVDISRLTLAP